MAIENHAPNMTEHLSTQELKDHRARTLATGEVLRVDEHLSACDSCQNRFFELAGLPDAAMQMSLPPSLDQDHAVASHLSYEQFAAHVDGTMDEVEREIADSHLLFCRPCADEIKELREFSHQISQMPATQIPAQVIATESRSGFAERWRAWLSSFSPLQAAATFAAIALVVAAAWAIRRTVAQDTQTQVAQAPASDKDARPTTNGSRTTNDETEATANVNEKIAPDNASRADETNAPPPVVVALNDGARQVGLDGQGNLVGLETLPPATQRAVKEALKNEGLKRPAMLDDLSGQNVTLLDPTAEGVPFTLSSPTGVVVENARPTLRWHPLNGANGYVVSIFDGNFKQVAKSAQLSNTSWKPAQPLARGRVYSWQVTALKDGREIVSPAPPAPEARFKVLEAAKAQEIAEARRLGSHLTLGILYARAGLIDEATGEFQMLVKKNPNSTLARRLLNSMQSWRRK